MLILRLLPSTVRLTPKMVRHLTSANTTSTQIASETPNSMEERSAQCTNLNFEENDVLFTSYGSRGLITLNRPKQLNAINLSMVQKLFPKIIEWENNKELIVIKGNSPKAFCAGGDVVSIAKDKTGKEGRDYFRCEYLNNALIASLQVPYVALIHGIVMGGGVGVSIHGKYRVATETSLFAMPETQIGLFPDVGVSHFLARMPYSLGSFLALTGYRIKGYDLVHTGIATHFCHSECLSDLEGELMKSDTDVEQVLQAFHEKSIKMVQKLPERIPPITTSKEPAFTLSDNLDNIEYAFSASTVEEILVRLDERRNPFIAELIDLLGKMSPLSLKVSHHQIRVTDELDVYETLNQDYRLAWRLLNEHDYYEGVRALLIDKDKNPQWDPSCLADVSDELVQDMFLPLDEEDELNLPESLKMEKSKL